MNPLTLSQNVLRVVYLLVLGLGIALWTGKADSVQGVHIVLGIITVVALWAFAGLQAMRGGSLPLVILAVVLGAAQIVIGLGQLSWGNGPLVAILHLVIGLAAIGIAEASGARLSRAMKA